MTELSKLYISKCLTIACFISVSLSAQVQTPQVQIPQVQTPQVQGLDEVNKTMQLGDDLQRSQEELQRNLSTVEAHKGTEVNAAAQMIPLVSAEIRLKAVAIGPAITQQDRLRNLRDSAAQELDALRNLGWQLSFAGLTACLSVRPLTFSERQRYEAQSSDPETMWQEARNIAGEYFDTLAEIESITHDRAIAEEHRREYAQNLIVLMNGNYSVNASNSTTRTSPNQFTPQPPAPENGKRCHIETRTQSTQTQVAIGSDGNGNKIYGPSTTYYEQPYLVCQ